MCKNATPCHFFLANSGRKKQYIFIRLCAWGLKINYIVYSVCGAQIKFQFKSRVRLWVKNDLKVSNIARHCLNLQSRTRNSNYTLTHSSLPCYLDVHFLACWVVTSPCLHDPPEKQDGEGRRLVGIGHYTLHQTAAGPAPCQLTAALPPCARVCIHSAKNTDKSFFVNQTITVQH